MRANTTVPIPSCDFPLSPRNGVTTDPFGGPLAGLVAPPMPYTVKLPKAPATVCAAGPNGSVEVPIITSEESNGTKVPSTAIADPPC